MTDTSKLRICVMYDCLFPYTMGGAERWYRNLAERLADDGHRVTYLTLRQWDEGENGAAAGVDVVAVGPRLPLYGANGARRIGPPLRFGLGVFWHLLRHGRSYDVVHTASFPFFSLLAAAILRPFLGYSIVVDWHEFWSRSYWGDYLGSFKGRIGWAVQDLCTKVPQRAFCFARLTAQRIEAHGVNGRLSILEGEYEGPLDACEPRAAEPMVVFAGRHIPEKRATAVIPAVMRARASISGLTARIFGTGPETHDLIVANARIAEQSGETPIAVCGHVHASVVEDHLSRAMCMLLPSVREGYGMIVVEAAAKGTPSILVLGEDNAATEHIEDGVNGYVAASASPDDLAAAILKVHEGGHALRVSTADWFARNAVRLSLRTSLATVVASYHATQTTARKAQGGWSIWAPFADERIRYATVSAGCFVLHNAIVIGGAALGLHYAVATCVSFVILVLVGYMTHAVFTFRSRASAAALGAYAMACLVNLPVALAVMYAFCTVLQLPVAIGTPMTSGVMVVFNYVAAKLAIGQSGARSNTLQTNSRL